MEIIFTSSKFFVSVLSPKFKFKMLKGSVEWLLRYSTFNNLMSSSIGGRLNFKNFFILVWSLKIEFKI
jgi:hypothetical protein